MRTTVTLDPDVEALLKRRMRERGVSFKEAVNEGLRAGLTGTGRPGAVAELRSPTFRLGRARVDLTKALQLAGDLEDAEIVRKAQTGK